MDQTIRSYFSLAVSPFKTHKNWENEEFGAFEAVSMSWPFKIIQACYGLLSLQAAALAYDYLDDRFPSIFKSFDFTQIAERNVLMLTVLGVVLFPLSSLGFFYFFRAVIIFCLELFGLDSEDSAQKNTVERVIWGSFVSNIFLLIPIFGPLFRTGAASIYLYAGLKEGLHLKSKQCFAVLMAPIILMALLLAMFLSVIYVLITTTFDPMIFM